MSQHSEVPTEEYRVMINRPELANYEVNKFGTCRYAVIDKPGEYIYSRKYEDEKTKEKYSVLIDLNKNKRYLKISTLKSEYKQARSTKKYENVSDLLE